MKDWNDLMERLQGLCDSEILLNEQRWLKEKYIQSFDQTDVTWENYSDKEKQVRRIKFLIQMKKTENYESDFFKMEESIIDLYEAIESCLNNLNSTSDNLLEIKLTAYLLLIKKLINRHKDPRKNKDFYLSELRKTIKDCLNSEKEDYFISDVNILYLDCKVELLQRIIGSVY